MFFPRGQGRPPAIVTLSAPDGLDTLLPDLAPAVF
jgi:hypothetical protein